MTDVAQAALDYAAAGYKVLPVFGKRPITPNGKSDATTSAAVIKAWWEGSPTSGVGLLIPDDIVVVDIDSSDSLKALGSFGFSLPSTVTAKSKRGWHLWYRRTSTTPPTRKIGIIPGVDLLVNGYVVAPPTKGYTWDVSLSESSISEAPEWLETLITQANKEHERLDPDEMLAGLPVGERNTGLFRYACSLRGRGKSTVAEAKVLLREAARQAAEGSIEFPPAFTDSLVERVWKTYDKKKREEEREAKHPKPKSLAELMAEPIPPTIKLVDKLLPAYGYTLLTSPPKIGKSSFAQYISACVATGTKVWGRFATKHTGVLYLDLEQSPYDAQERWKNLLGKMGIEIPPSNLFVEFEWPALDEGGIDRIKEFLIDHPNVSLIVIDTFADFYPADEGGNSNAYHREQRIVKQFLPLSRDYGCAILLVHHDSKNGHRELVGRSSGSYALTGKASAIWHLSREDNGIDGWLETTGKNVPKVKASIKFDSENTFWDLQYAHY